MRCQDCEGPLTQMLMGDGMLVEACASCLGDWLQHCGLPRPAEPIERAEAAEPPSGARSLDHAVPA